MGKKLPTTPRSRVRSALRQVFLRSRERAACLKAAGHACERCHVKGSVAVGKEQKIHVHHRSGVGNWEKIIDLVFAELLPDPSQLEALCPACHDKEHHP
jgi:predicted HNH restriction endonuclease